MKHRKQINEPLKVFVSLWLAILVSVAVIGSILLFGVLISQSATASVVVMMLVFTIIPVVYVWVAYGLIKDWLDDRLR